ncbi:hypothetical protein [Methylorubrum extorquens]|uniref:hypothetical protein n=1 Tax=Methylorubrum extorquens TaxID=408 RepID=UPI0011BE40B2|nr:hypothetical protein [Methylorubrum extorquens]
MQQWKASFVDLIRFRRLRSQISLPLIRETVELGGLEAQRIVDFTPSTIGLMQKLPRELQCEAAWHTEQW